VSTILLSLVLLGAAAEVQTRETPTERLFVLTVPPGVAFQLDGKSAAQVVDVPSDATKMIVEVELDGNASQRREVAVVAAGRVPQIKFEFGRANARTRVQEFLAAALAGKVGEAAALADDQFPVGQIRELRDQIKARTVSVVTVLASDTGPRKKALAITQRVQVTKADPDGRDTGKLAITLAKRDDRGWFVEDIDFGSEESIKDEVVRFLKEFPGARPVPPLPSHEEAFPGDCKIPRRDFAPSAAPADKVSGASTPATSEDIRASVRVYLLRHTKAQDVVEQIRRMLRLGGQFGADSRMSIGADLRMNAIVVSADAKMHKTVEELLTRLDGAQQQPSGAASASEGRRETPAARYKDLSITALEQAIAKLQHDVALAEAKAQEAAAAVREAEQAEKAASGETKTAALLRKLRAEVAAQREADVLREIRQDFQTACRAYQAAIAAVGTEEEQPGDSASVWPVAAFDGFDSRLDLPWKPIRHDPTHVSLDKHPGKLTIITQRGSIHGDEKHDEYGGGIQAKNIFVIDNPLCNGEDFAMTTCVENFTPQTPYQQAGLICYDDDDNYLKFGYEFCWPKGAGHTFTCVREIAAKSNFDVADAKPGITKYWLRIIKRGNKYQYAYSYDGQHYVRVGEQDWGNGKPKKLGLLAKNGGNQDARELYPLKR
jgi:regulation of enolase protein 1 (concanavalin A-like superfamily)